MAEPASVWTSLEVAKLVVGAATPVALAVFGVVVARGARRVEGLQAANRSVVEQRVKVFETVAVRLNKLLCFATFVGRWKEISEREAITLKREVDEQMYAHRPLFSAALFEAYEGFMECLFAMYATVDGDALIRCQVTSQWGSRASTPWWDRRDSPSRFTTDRATTAEQAQAAYDRLAAALRDDLYVTALTRPLPPPARD